MSLPFPDIPQVRSDRENGDHDRHDEQSKMQRPASPAEQMLKPDFQHFNDRIHDSLLSISRNGDVR
jgi:hypothetical protein